MSESTKNLHPALTMPYSQRASLPATSPLAAYLLQLMDLKRSNLCLSADVTTSAELISLAEEVGDSICMLKTHADIISDFSDHTVHELKAVAARKRFLVFEDRKFGDIRSTVEKQYVGGLLGIAKWAEISTAHIFPGPAIVSTLEKAASSVITAYNTTVHTEISVGHRDKEIESDGLDGHAMSSNVLRRYDSEGSNETLDSDKFRPGISSARKQSIVSISTTISTRSEPISPRPISSLASKNLHSYRPSSREEAFERLGQIPFLRAILLLAEMSSEGNLLTPSYAQQCVKIGRQHPDFVMGFVAQKSLNTEPEDNFLTFTPGVKLSADDAQAGDGMGQQYRGPREVILRDGSDVIIVGRGILQANDRQEEAERYRKQAWKAYEERISLHS